jgi:hypothetical protein
MRRASHPDDGHRACFTWPDQLTVTKPLAISLPTRVARIFAADLAQAPSHMEREGAGCALSTGPLVRPTIKQKHRFQ